MKKIALLSLTLCTMMFSCEKSNIQQNPFFSVWDTPYGVPPFDKIETQHYRPAFDSAMVLNLAQIDSIVNNTAEPTFENVILALDQSGEMLSQVNNVFGQISSADTNDELMAIEEAITPILAAHYDKISMNDALFVKVKSVYDKRESLGLDSLQMRLLNQTYRDFVRAGAMLSNEDKAALKRINESLSILEVKFGNNLLSDNKAFVLELEENDLSGLPDGVKEAAATAAKNAGKENKYLFTLDKPSLLPFITYSDRRDLRQKLYEGYLNRCNYDNDSDNKSVINDIIRLRTERVNLLGFDTYAEYALDIQMAKNPKNVYDLLDDLWKPALNVAKQELKEMKKIKVAETGDESFESWDWWYYAEKVRKAKYDLDEEMIRPYLSLDNVTSGIFDLSNRLWGITFRPVHLPVYNDEVVAYEVLDKDNTHLAVIYMDFFPRPGKRGGAWCGGFREQSYKNGQRVAPVVYITCNFTRPSKGKPALLSIEETETYFHEFGHALQSFFSDVKYNGLGGLQRDFVELPSQIMENWSMNPKMLKSYATHYETSNPMPETLIDKIHNSSLFNQGFVTLEYLGASLSDMDIHNIKSYKTIDVNAFEKEVLNVKRGMIPQIAPRYRYPYFQHIFSSFAYSAGYYSYIWAEVLDKDAYQAFVESGDIFNRDVAARFRKLLSSGGQADGMVLYEQFRGKAPSREPLLKARGLQTKDETHLVIDKKDTLPIHLKFIM